MICFFPLGLQLAGTAPHHGAEEQQETKHPIGEKLLDVFIRDLLLLCKMHKIYINYPRMDWGLDLNKIGLFILQSKTTVHMVYITVSCSLIFERRVTIWMVIQQSPQKQVSHESLAASMHCTLQLCQQLLENEYN